MRNDWMRSHIWGVSEEQSKKERSGGAYVGVSLMGGVSVQFVISPDEARELAAELTAAANLAEGGKA